MLSLISIFVKLIIVVLHTQLVYILIQRNNLSLVMTTRGCIKVSKLYYDFVNYVESVINHAKILILHKRYFFGSTVSTDLLKKQTFEFG